MAVICKNYGIGVMLMKHFFKLIYSNKFFAFLMLALQLAIIGLSWNLYGGSWEVNWRIIHYGSAAISIALIVYEVNRNSEPTFKLTWLLIISAIPVFGILLYLFTRSSIGTKVMMEQYREMQRVTKENLVQDKTVFENLEKEHPESVGIAKYLRKCSGAPVYNNTDVKYFQIGEEMLEDIKQELAKAKKFIFMEYFIINAHMNSNENSHIWEEILCILKEKVKEGVEVRILYDGMGCLGTLPKGYSELLESYGIKCRIFSPIVPLISTHQNNRDHRKICVVDGRCAYTGGINLADEYANRIVRFGHWKDTGIKVTGEAVEGFCALFLEMWNLTDASESAGKIASYITVSQNYKNTEAKGYVIPFGDTPLDDDEVGKRVYIDVLNNSSDHVYIATPYLVIDYELYEALKYAVQRGVEVCLIMPHIPDKKYAFYLSRIYYYDLINSGVKIYEYKKGFVHAKMSVGDGKRAVVGTINHDFRSLYLHYECAALLIDVPEIEKIEEDFKKMMDESIKADMTYYKSLPLGQRLFGRAIRLVAPLL